MLPIEVWLTTDTGARLASLDTYSFLAATRVANKIGSFSMSLPPNFNPNYLKPDNIIQIWLGSATGRMYLWRPYFLRKWEYRTVGGIEQLTISGPDVNDFLRRRISMYPAGVTNWTAFSLEAVDMMREYVRLNTTSVSFPHTSSVPTTPSYGTRVLDANYWSIIEEQSIGTVIDKQATYKNLLTKTGAGILPEIAESSRTAGSPAFFSVEPDIVETNKLTYKFITSLNQPKVDVSDKIVFSDADGSLQNGYYIEDYTDEENYVYAGGQGEGIARTVKESWDETRIEKSLWNRCEGFADARNSSTDAAVEAKAQEAVAQGRPKISAGGNIKGGTGKEFLKHWDWGYMVGAKYRQFQWKGIVESVTITVAQNSLSVAANLSYEGAV